MAVQPTHRVNEIGATQTLYSVDSTHQLPISSRNSPLAWSVCLRIRALASSVAPAERCAQAIIDRGADTARLTR